MKSHQNKEISYSVTNVLKFLIPSLIGVFLFMTPIPTEDGLTIPIAILSNGLQASLEAILPMIIIGVVTLSGIGTVLANVVKTRLITEHKFLSTLFVTTPIWFVLRILAVLFVYLVYFNVGLEMIYSGNTGGLVFYDLLPILFSVFLFAGFFLPLLLNFGLLEFVGSLLVKIMRPVFNLPGRSAIDCIASWLGDGTIGVLLTSKQYEEGFYTQREAAVIGTTFSLVSITFSLVVIDSVGLSHMFVPFYLTVTVASIVAAIVMPKLSPLSKKPDTFIDGRVKEKTQEVVVGSSIKNGFKSAVEKAQSVQMFEMIVVKGIQNVIEMWINVIPVVMGVGTLALIIAEYTPVFTILGLPFVPLLMLLQIPEAMQASQTLVSGFADMLLPSILAGDIQSELTRFVIASVSVTQLIYLSEVGALLLGSKIPVTFKDLCIIFIQRTLVTLPVVAILAHLIF